MGFLQFDSNEQSNYTTREMKSAYLSDRNQPHGVMYLKFLIHGYHSNKLNIFN